MSNLKHLDSLLDRVVYLQSILIDRATGGEADDGDFQLIRKELLETSSLKSLMPSWIKHNRSLSQFWQYIKHKYGTYDERRKYIYTELSPLLDFLEDKSSYPAQQSVEDIINKLDAESVKVVWAKAIERRRTDPEGAITISRTILESVCKHILAECRVSYNSNSIELSELYRLTAKELNLAPEQHQEKIFKQILGGCSGVVNGLGTLRNKLGDAHSQGPKQVKPKPRHAELAVNLAGAMSLFLLSTYEESKYDT